MTDRDVFDTPVKEGDHVVFGGQAIHYARVYATSCGLPFTRKFCILNAYPDGMIRCSKCFKEEPL